MTLRSFALACAFAAPALADTGSEVKAHEAVFAHACQAGDVKAVMGLYADDAVVVWPGAGAEAKGKEAIERLVADFCARRIAAMVLESVDVISLGDAHVAVVGHWKDTVTRPNGTRVTADVRATEVLVRREPGWLYLVQHASIGVPRARPGVRRERRTR